MKLRLHGDSQDPELDPEEVVGEMLATPRDRRAGGYGHAPKLCVFGGVIAALRQTGSRTKA
jgi:hypothetical protein